MSDEKDPGYGKSGLELYSLAIVVTDKADASDMIEATPIEHLPFTLGPVKEDVTNYQTEAPNAQGVPTSSSAKKDRTIIAKWYDISGGNRVTAPDVYKGETVLLLRFADADKYFWVKIGREPSLRKLETIQYAVSNLRGSGAFDNDSSYYVLISTKEKKIQFHTSNNDGEPYSYDIELDTAKGIFSFRDSNTNVVEIDSGNNLMTIDMNVHIKRKLDVDKESALHDTLDVDKDTSIKGNTQVEKHTTVGGGMTVRNSSGGSGGVMEGNFEVIGNISVTGDVDAGGTVTGHPVIGCPNA